MYFALAKRTSNMKSTYILIGLLALSLQALAQDTTRYFRGYLPTGPDSLLVELKFTQQADSSWKASFKSPWQAEQSFNLSRVTFSRETVKFANVLMSLQFAGAFDSETSFTGHWIQQKDSTLMTFRSAAAAFEFTRPQMPKAPFPYTIDSFELPGAAEGVTLSATLTLPQGEGPFPAVILLSGSGPSDRDETLFGHKPFWVLADHLSRNGIAVLRYDDRGTGLSTGDFKNATSLDFAQDGLAAFEWLKQNPAIDSVRLGFMGHSEGGILAALAAQQEESVGFVISLAGPGVDFFDLLAKQQAEVFAQNGTDEATIQKETTMTLDVAKAIRSTPDPKELSQKVRDILMHPQTGDSKTAMGKIGFYLSPWAVYFARLEVAKVWRAVKCPVLALNGSKDVQVDADQNLRGIAFALARGGNKHYSIMELDGLNHLFQHCTSCKVSEYAQLDETFSPEALDIITRWILVEGHPSAEESKD